MKQGFISLLLAVFIIGNLISCSNPSSESDAKDNQTIERLPSEKENASGYQIVDLTKKTLTHSDHVSPQENSPSIEETANKEPSRPKVVIPPKPKVDPDREKQPGEGLTYIISGSVVGLQGRITLSLNETSINLNAPYTFALTVGANKPVFLSVSNHLPAYECLPTPSMIIPTQNVDNVIINCQIKMSVGEYTAKYPGLFSTCLKAMFSNAILLESIDKLTCQNNNIQNIDEFSLFTGLTFIDFSGNALATLDLSQTTKLEHLDLHNNALTLLDLSNNLSLYYLDLRENAALASVDLSRHRDLSHIDLPHHLASQQDNRIQATGSVTGLENQVITIQAGEHAQTTSANSVFEFTLKKGEPFAINATNLPEDKFCVSDKAAYQTTSDNLNFSLSCFDKITTGLYQTWNYGSLSQCITSQYNYSEYAFNIKRIECYSDASISSAPDLHYFHNVEILALQHNGLTAVDLTKNHYLKTLSLQYNDIKAIDLSQNLALEYLDLRGNDNLNTIDLSHNSKLRWIDLPEHLAQTEDNVFNLKGQVTGIDHHQDSVTVNFAGQEFEMSNETHFDVNMLKADTQNIVFVSQPAGKTCRFMQSFPELPTDMTNNILCE